MSYFDAVNLGKAPAVGVGVFRPSGQTLPSVAHPAVPAVTKPVPPGVSERRLVQNRIVGGESKFFRPLLSPPEPVKDAGLQQNIDDLMRVRRSGLFKEVLIKKAVPLEKNIDVYLRSKAGLSVNGIKTFDILAKRLQAEFHRVGASGITPGADAIRKFDLYGAVRILLNFDGIQIPEELLVESVDRIVRPMDKLHTNSAQRFAYLQLTKKDPKTLPEPLKELRQNIVDEGALPATGTVPATTIVTTPPTISPPPAPASYTTGVVPAAEAGSGEVPLFTEVASKIGGLGGAALLALGVFIFASSAKREFGSGRKRRRRG